MLQGIGITCSDAKTNNKKALFKNRNGSILTKVISAPYSTMQWQMQKTFTPVPAITPSDFNKRNALLILPIL